MKKKNIKKLLNVYKYWLESSHVRENHKLRFSRLIGKKLCGLDILLDRTKTLEKISFRSGDLRDTEFINFKFHGVDFTNTNLWGCTFEKTKLIDVNFSKANLKGCSFSDVELTNVTVSCLYTRHVVGYKLKSILDKIDRYGFEEHKQSEGCGKAGCIGAKLSIILQTERKRYNQGAQAFAMHLGYASIAEMLIGLTPFWSNHDIFSAFDAGYSAYTRFSSDFKGVMQAWYKCVENLTVPNESAE